MGFPINWNSNLSTCVWETVSIFVQNQNTENIFEQIITDPEFDPYKLGVK